MAPEIRVEHRVHLAKPHGNKKWLNIHHYSVFLLSKISIIKNKTLMKCIVKSLLKRKSNVCLDFFLFFDWYCQCASRTFLPLCWQIADVPVSRHPCSGNPPLLVGRVPWSQQARRWFHFRFELVFKAKERKNESRLLTECEYWRSEIRMPWRELARTQVVWLECPPYSLLQCKNRGLPQKPGKKGKKMSFLWNDNVWLNKNRKGRDCTADSPWTPDSLPVAVRRRPEPVGRQTLAFGKSRHNPQQKCPWAQEEPEKKSTQRKTWKNG